MSLEDYHLFVEQLLPYVKSFAYVWFNLQAVKRKHYKMHDKRMAPAQELQYKEKFLNEKPEVKQKWASRLLGKLRKDIQHNYREEFVSSITGANAPVCIISNPDQKGKMRRIDCLRQADKVWRIDLVMVVLFKAIPLESTDGERLLKSPLCLHPALCVNPYHISISVRELDLYLASFLHHYEPADVSSDDSKAEFACLPGNDGILANGAFATQELAAMGRVPVTYTLEQQREVLAHNADRQTDLAEAAAVPVSVYQDLLPLANAASAQLSQGGPVQEPGPRLAPNGVDTRSPFAPPVAKRARRVYHNSISSVDSADTDREVDIDGHSQHFYPKGPANQQVAAALGSPGSFNSPGSQLGQVDPHPSWTVPDQQVRVSRGGQGMQCVPQSPLSQPPGAAFSPINSSGALRVNSTPPRPLSNQPVTPLNLAAANLPAAPAPLSSPNRTRDLAMTGGGVIQAASSGSVPVLQQAVPVSLVSSCLVSDLKHKSSDSQARSSALREMITTGRLPVSFNEEHKFEPESGLTDLAVLALQQRGRPGSQDSDSPQRSPTKLPSFSMFPPPPLPVARPIAVRDCDVKPGASNGGSTSTSVPPFGLLSAGRSELQSGMYGRISPVSLITGVMSPLNMLTSPMVTPRTTPRSTPVPRWSTPGLVIDPELDYSIMSLLACEPPSSQGHSSDSDRHPSGGVAASEEEPVSTSGNSLPVAPGITRA